MSQPEEVQRLSVQLSEATSVMLRVMQHMQHTNSQLLGISSELLAVKREVQASVRRQSGLLVLLCAALLASIYLAWQTAAVSDAVSKSLRESGEIRVASEAAQKSLEASAKRLEEMEVVLKKQSEAVQGMVDEAPRVLRDARGQTYLEVVDQKSSTSDKARIPISGGRIGK